MIDDELNNNKSLLGRERDRESYLHRRSTTTVPSVGRKEKLQQTSNDRVRNENAQFMNIFSVGGKTTRKTQKNLPTLKATLAKTQRLT